MFVLGVVTQCIGDLADVSPFVVAVLGLLSRTVNILRQLPCRVVAQILGASECIVDGDGETAFVVIKPCAVTQSIFGFNEVAAIVVLIGSPRARGINEFCDFS
ncbi:hypothetical protein SDC9_94275 [bioreactor metagenome]|uniref:Uncharacterized protein n=1 Tax=bioreactor metagenome TaxID=1076179 RepID=A0A645AD14_9ZZZZ